MKNQATFKEYMTVLSDLHDKPLSELTIRLYWKALEPFTDDECQKAFEALILSSRFFPKPVDFIEVLRGKTEDQATRAWLKVAKAISRIGNYQSVQFDDLVIHSAIQGMGGWPKICQSLEKDMPWCQKEFERLYGLMSLGCGNHPSYLPGQCEIDNSARGYDRDTDIITIGFDGKADQKQIVARKPHDMRKSNIMTSKDDQKGCFCEEKNS
jgi:hypothetical protein